MANPTHDSLARLSRGLRDASWTLEHAMAETEMQDVPRSVIRALTEAVKAVAGATASKNPYTRDWRSHIGICCLTIRTNIVYPFAGNTSYGYICAGVKDAYSGAVLAGSNCTTGQSVGINYFGGRRSGPGAINYSGGGFRMSGSFYYLFI